MKVILLQAVPKLGKEGHVVNVKPGYARNYLFPQGMATVADKRQLQVLERRNAKMAAVLAETKSDAEKLREELHGKTLEIQVKAGKDTDKLFGAVTSEQIAEALKEQFGQTVERKQVLLIAPIKRLGTYGVEINAHRDVDIEVKVHVFDPEHEEEEKAKEVQEAAQAVSAELGDESTASASDEPVAEDEPVAAE